MKDVLIFDSPPEAPVNPETKDRDETEVDSLLVAVTSTIRTVKMFLREKGAAPPKSPPTTEEPQPKPSSSRKRSAGPPEAGAIKVS